MEQDSLVAEQDGSNCDLFCVATLITLNRNGTSNGY